MSSLILWLIPIGPLVGAIAIATVGRVRFPEKCHWPCVGGAVWACFFSLIAFLIVAIDEPISTGGDLAWIRAGDVSANFSLHADGLTAVMLVMVTFIGSLIAIYSAGYMHGDPGYSRFFAEVSGFLFFMTGLVLASNFILLYAAWEGVGLCSYLLIGFWYAKPSAAAAARKAFLVTRLGDIGLFIGIMLLWHNHPTRSLEYDAIFANAAQYHSSGVLFWACICLFIGAAGKSAQFPLHVWLPDAMEGPSPVSALIHAATMVTAGVYLIARCTPLFGLEPNAQLLVAGIGAFTALLAALIALTQMDLKRVLAYSTMSQLGYMFLALGCGLGSDKLAGLAVFAAIFHLFTHAFFKALLFLGAGSVMHAMGDTCDMRQFSGLKKSLPVTHWTFLCGAAALAGVPILSGFWSKDEILLVASKAWQAGSGMQSALYALLYFTAIATAGLTAFYTFRAYFLTFWGVERFPDNVHHPHEAPPVMAWPLKILAVGALGVGLLLGPTGWFEAMLDHRWIQLSFEGMAAKHSGSVLVMLSGSVVALGGIALAYWMYVMQPGLADDVARKAAAAYEFSSNKFFFDEIYELIVVKPMNVFAQVCRIVDTYLLDGLVDLLGQVPAFFGFLVRPMQNGLVQWYALLTALGVAGFLMSVLLK